MQKNYILDESITEALTYAGFDYNAEVVSFPAEGRFTVVLHGDRHRWFDEEPRVLARLRTVELRWRSVGWRASYVFMDRAAMVAF